MNKKKKEKIKGIPYSLMQLFPIHISFFPADDINDFERGGWIRTPSGAGGGNLMDTE